jgi:predicted alpha/beta-fold hydrolase
MHKLPVKVLYWRDHTERLSRKHAMYHASAFMRIKVKYLSRRIKAEGGNRPVWIWGAGKTAKQFAELLKAEGIPISGYVEVNRRKTGAEIVHYTDLGAPSGRIVLGHVGNRGAGDKIRQWLLEHNWTEGIDFWICA